MESRGNPYSLTGEQRLHNFVSNAVVPEVQAQKPLNFRTIADLAYSSLRDDRLLDRVKTVSDAITKQKLPTFMTIQKDVSKPTQSTANIVKHPAFAHRFVDVMKERGMPMAVIMI